MDFDVAISETNNGGDLTLLTNDLAVINNIENCVYLAMFGGNLEASTTPEQSNNNLDWWGNRLFLQNQIVNQFNSETERTLNSTPLTSSGRVIIENAIKTDLSFLNIKKIEVQITATDRLEVELIVQSNNTDSDLRIFFAIQLPSDAGDFSILDFNSDFF